MRTSVVGNIPPWMKFSKEQVFYDNSDNFFHLILRFCDEMCQLLSRSILFQESGYFFQDRWPVVPLLKWLQKISIPTILAVFKAFIKCPTSCALHENTKYKHNMWTLNSSSKDEMWCSFMHLCPYYKSIWQASVWDGWASNARARTLDVCMCVSLGKNITKRTRRFYE